MKGIYGFLTFKKNLKLLKKLMRALTASIFNGNAADLFQAQSLTFCQEIIGTRYLK